ncbi:MAG: YbjN domain-containing protein [Deltaproteobacteria bacterium]|jgi:hypothetical protein|nr:YbjN domain-containing protein [Deltaproteobacteria bacterium]
MPPKPALSAAAALAAVLRASCSGDPGDACGPLGSLDRAGLLRIIHDMGLEASGETGGNPPSDYVLWNYHGMRSYVLFFAEGEALQFRIEIADSAASWEDINSWNRDYRYSRSYLDTDGDSVLELDLDFAGGICEGRVRDWLKTCMAVLDRWMDLLPPPGKADDSSDVDWSSFPGEADDSSDADWSVFPGEP